MNDQDKAAAIKRAQKKADKTGSPHYVGLTYTCRYYVAKKRPTTEWLVETVSPAKVTA